VGATEGQGAAGRTNPVKRTSARGLSTDRPGRQVVLRPDPARTLTDLRRTGRTYSAIIEAALLAASKR
jgi:hypothetical protein